MDGPGPGPVNPKRAILYKLLSDPEWAAKSDSEVADEVDRRWAAESLATARSPAPPASDPASPGIDTTDLGGQGRWARRFVDVPRLPGPTPTPGFHPVADAFKVSPATEVDFTPVRDTTAVPPARTQAPALDPVALAARGPRALPPDDNFLASSLKSLADNPTVQYSERRLQSTAPLAPFEPTKAEFTPTARAAAIAQLRARAGELRAAAAPAKSPEADVLEAQANNLQTAEDREAETLGVLPAAADRWRETVPGMAALVNKVLTLPAGSDFSTRAAHAAEASVESVTGKSAAVDLEQNMRKGNIPTPEDLANVGIVAGGPHGATRLPLGEEPAPTAPRVATERPTTTKEAVEGTVGGLVADLPFFVATDFAGSAFARGLVGRAAVDVTTEAMEGGAMRTPGTRGLLQRFGVLAGDAEGAPLGRGNALVGALRRYANGGTLIGDTEGMGRIGEAAVRGAQTGVPTWSSMSYATARERGASRSDALSEAVTSAVVNVPMGAVLGVAEEVALKPLMEAAKRVWARAPEGSRWNTLRDFVLGPDAADLIRNSGRQVSDADVARTQQAMADAVDHEASVRLAVENAHLNDTRPEALPPTAIRTGEHPLAGYWLPDHGEALEVGVTHPPEAPDLATVHPTKPLDAMSDEELQQVETHLANKVVAQDAALESGDVTTGSSRGDLERVRDYRRKVLESKKVNGEMVHVVGDETNTFGADAGTQVKAALRGIDLNGEVGDPKEALAAFREANGYDRLDANGESRPASRVEASRLKQVIEGIQQRFRGRGREITADEAAARLGASRRAHLLRKYGGVALGAGVALAGQRSDRKSVQALAALPLVFTSAEHGELHITPGEFLAPVLRSAKEAGMLARELKETGWRGDVRPDAEGFRVLVKAPKDEGVKVPAAPPEPPFDPTLPPEQNRPAPGSPGRILQPDAQGRFVSRLGQALEAERPGLKLSLNEWEQRLTRSGAISETEVRGVFSDLRRTAASPPAPPEGSLPHGVTFEPVNDAAKVWRVTLPNGGVRFAHGDAREAVAEALTMQPVAALAAKQRLAAKAADLSRPALEGRLSASELLDHVKRHQFEVETKRYDPALPPEPDAKDSDMPVEPVTARLIQNNANDIVRQDPVGYALHDAVYQDPDAHWQFTPPEEDDSEARSELYHALGRFNIDSDFPEAFGGGATGDHIRDLIENAVVENNGELSDRQVERLTSDIHDEIYDQTDFSPFGDYAVGESGVGRIRGWTDGTYNYNGNQFATMGEASVARFNDIAEHFGMDPVTLDIHPPAPEEQLTIDPEHPEIQRSGRWVANLDGTEFVGDSREEVARQAFDALESGDFGGDDLYNNIRDHAEGELPDFRAAIERAADAYRNGIENVGDIDEYRSQFTQEHDLDDAPELADYGLTSDPSRQVLRRDATPVADLPSSWVADQHRGDEASTLSEARDKALDRPEGAPVYVKVGERWRYLTPDQGQVVDHLLKSGSHMTIAGLDALEREHPGITEKIAASVRRGDHSKTESLLKGQITAPAAPEGQEVVRFQPDRRSAGAPKWQDYGGRHLQGYREIITVLTHNPLETDAVYEGGHGYPKGTQHMARMGQWWRSTADQFPVDRPHPEAIASGEVERVLHLAETQSDHINDAGEEEKNLGFLRKSKGFREVTTERGADLPQRPQVLPTGRNVSLTGRGSLVADAADRDSRINEQTARRAARSFYRFMRERFPDLDWGKVEAEQRAYKSQFPDTSQQESWLQRNLFDLRDWTHAMPLLAPEGTDQQAWAHKMIAAREAWRRTPEAEALGREFEADLARQRAYADEMERRRHPESFAVHNVEGEPASPFTKQAHTARLGIQRLLTEAAEKNIGTVSWSSADEVTKRYGEQYRGLYNLLYDELLPSQFHSAMRWLGYTDNEYMAPAHWQGTVDNGNGLTNRWEATLPKDFAKRALRKGFPLLSLGAWMLADAMDPPPTQAQDGEPTEYGKAVRDRVLSGAIDIARHGLMAAGLLGLGVAATKLLRKGGGRALEGSVAEAALEAARHEMTGEHELLAHAASQALPRLTDNAIRRLGLPASLADEFKAKAQAMVDQHGVALPVTHDQTRAEAAKMLRVRPGALADLDPSKMSGAETLAVASMASERARRSAALAEKVADPTLSFSERDRLREQMAQADGEFLSLMSTVMRAGSAQGRALNANKVLATMQDDPTVWAMRAQRQLGPHTPLRPEQLADIRRLVANPDKAPLLQYLARLRKSSIPQQVVAILNAGLYTRPAARVLDLAGGIGNLLLDQGALSYPRAAFDYLIGKALTGRRTATALDAEGVKQVWRGMGDGLYDVARLMGLDVLKSDGIDAWVKAIRAADITPEMLQHFDIPHITTIDLLSATRNPETLPNQVVDFAQKAVYRSLALSDRVITDASYRGALREMALARAMTEGHPDPKLRAKELVASPPDDLREAAMTYATSVLLNNNGAAAEMTNAILSAPGRALRSVGAGDMAADVVDAGLRYVVPTRRVPANMAARATDFAGFGFLSGIWNIARAAHEEKLGHLTAGAPEESAAHFARADASQRRAVEALARATAGTGLMALGAYGYEQGWMTGSAPTNPSERAQWDAEGKQANSILWRGKWRPLGRLAPGGMVVALGATLADLHRRGQAVGLAGRGLAVTRTVLDQPLVTGSRTMLDAVRDPAGMGERFSESQASRLVPTVVGMAAQDAAGGAYRDPDGPVQAIEAKLDPEGRAGLWSRIPARRTALGDPLTTTPGFSNLWNPFASTVDRRINDPLVGELARVGWKPQPPKRAPDETNVQFEQRATAEGHAVRAQLTKTVASPSYRNAEVIAARLLKRPESLGALAKRYGEVTPTTLDAAADLVRRDMLANDERITRSMVRAPDPRHPRNPLADSLATLAGGH